MLPSGGRRPSHKERKPNFHSTPRKSAFPSQQPQALDRAAELQEQERSLSWPVRSTVTQGANCMLGFVPVQREKPHCLSAPWFVAVLLKLPSHAVADLVGTKFPGSHPQRFQFGRLGLSLWPGTSNKLTGMARWYRCYWSKDPALNIASF